MNHTSLVMKATFTNNLRWRTIAVVTFGIILICIVGVAAMFIMQFISPEVKAISPDRAVLRNILGLILFCTSFFSVGIYSTIFAAQSLMREKTRGNIQALLATPVSPADICLGKTLGVFLPGFLFSLVMTLTVYLLVNMVYLVPVTGFIGSPWMFISSLVAVPMIFLLLVILIHLIGMTGKAMTGNIIGQIPLSLISAVMINLSARNVVAADSWLFAVILFGIAALAGVAILILSKKLVTERVILSQ